MAITNQVPGPAGAQAFAAATSGAVTSTTTHTITEDAGNRAHDVILASVMGQRAANAPGFSLSCTFGGFAMNTLGSVWANGDSAGNSTLTRWFYLFNPPTGPQAIAPSWDSAGVSAAPNLAWASVSLSGVDSLQFASEFGTETGTAMSIIRASEVGRKVLALLMAERVGGTPVSTPNQTQLAALVCSTTADGLLCVADGAASVEFTAVRQSGGDYAESVVDLLPYVAPPVGGRFFFAA